MGVYYIFMIFFVEIQKTTEAQIKLESCAYMFQKIYKEFLHNFEI